MRVAIIGGGASGLMAAISAAYEGHDVTILERLDRIGKKILATGNGRCNFTNINSDIKNFHGKNPGFIKNAMEKFWVNDTISFFETLGMLTTVEENGKAYPYSLQASAVLDVLRFEIERLNINITTNFEVKSINKKNNSFLIESYDANTEFADKVIISTGGKSSPSLGSNGSGYDILKKLGHTLTDIFPSLVQVKTDTKYVKALKGIKVNANVTVKNNTVLGSSSGEVLFTDYGLSGPAIFNISRLIAEYKNTKIILDLLPRIDYNNLRELLIKRKSPTRNLENYFVGMINKKIGMTLLKYADILPYQRSSDTLTNKEIDTLIKAIKSFEFETLGTTSWNNAQVTAGGILTDEVNPQTLESKLIKGLYITGEILDIDGDCGGHNLQWAWTSGYIAGKCL